MYMDYRDFEAAQRIVAELANCMRVLPESHTNPRPFRAILGNLTDFLMHVYHHTLGGKCMACDLDFIEVRDNKIAALMELKKQSHTMSPIQELVTSTIARKLDVPMYLLYPDRDFTRFVVAKPKSNEQLVLNRREFYEFMQEFEAPTTGLDSKF